MAFVDAITRVVYTDTRAAVQVQPDQLIRKSLYSQLRNHFTPISWLSIKTRPSISEPRKKAQEVMGT
jgi:hypothetical protein